MFGSFAFAFLVAALTPESTIWPSAIPFLTIVLCLSLITCGLVCLWCKCTDPTARELDARIKARCEKEALPARAAFEQARNERNEAIRNKFNALMQDNVRLMAIAGRMGGPVMHAEALVVAEAELMMEKV